MELPYHLKTLEPLTGALDILRYLGGLETPIADSDEICEALDLSDIGFRKAIRRLVTQGYVVMDGAMTYRIAERGREAYETLMEYDAENPAGDADDDEEEYMQLVTRRLVVALPRTLTAEQPNAVVVGVEGADDEAVLNTPADLVLRLSVLNGQPDKPLETAIALGNEPVQHNFSITPDAYKQVRVRVQVFQLGPNPDDINVSGGLYIDADVTSASSSQPSFVAYGGNLAVQVLE